MLLFSCLVIFSFIFFYRREGAYYGCIFSLLFDELVFIICFTTQISTLTIDELGKVNIEYEQSNASPFFKITKDENIQPHLDIKIKGKTLIIQPKDEKKYFNGNSYGLNLQPTVCEIKTSSRELKEISAVGGGEFIAKSPLKADKLDISIAGSSTINFDKQLEARKINFSVAGSGDINATQLKVDNLDCSVAGSGSILLKGEAERGDLSVAGGGDISAFGCVLRNAFAALWLQM